MPVLIGLGLVVFMSRMPDKELGQDVVDTVNLTVNGEGVATSAETLADLLDELGYGERTVATALNGDFVPVGQRQVTRLHQGANVEIVAPRQGG